MPLSLESEHSKRENAVMEDPMPDERFPVWAALSEFFLDTELNETDYQRIASALVKSGYTVGKLRDILYFEVYPACYLNLLDVAGEWAGFPPDWIMRNIAPRKDKKPLLPVGPLFLWMFQRHWNRVSLLIKEPAKV